MTADQAGDRTHQRLNEGQVSSEAFTKGRFDQSESLAQHRSHGHQPHHIMLASRELSQAEQEAESHERRLKREAEERRHLADANDGLIHGADGKKYFVENGAEVAGVNQLTQISHAHKKHSKHQKLAQESSEEKELSEQEVTHKHAVHHGHAAHKKAHAVHQKKHGHSSAQMLAEESHKSAKKHHAQQK